VRKKICFYIPLLCWILLLTSCARPGSPSGGPEDKKPPQVVAEKSDANFQTNFKPKEINLEFSEYIELRNAFKQVVISPPTDYLLQVKSRGKKVQVIFDEREMLKDDVTYQINFGDAIVDYTANNALKNYSFVFATGDIIDSLSIKGNIIDDYTGEPEKDITIMLYDKLDDSIVYKEKPFYFTKSDGQGNFQLNNLRSDTFKIFALMDGNLNYIYDSPLEKIAYLDSLIFLNDTISYNISLRAFNELQDQKINEVLDKETGIIKTVLERPFEEINFTLSDTTKSINAYTWRDSFFIEYSPVNDSTFYLYAEPDTFKISPRSKNKSTLEVYKTKPELGDVIHPASKVQLFFNRSLIEVTDTLIILQDTSGNAINTTLEIEDGILSISALFLDTTDYILFLYPEAVKSYNKRITDTLNYNIRAGLAEQFGNITVNTRNLNPENQYLFSLMSGQQKLEQYISGADTTDITFTQLKAGTYTLEVLEDRNENKTWDPQHYLRKEKSEKIIEKKLEQLREGWDLNIDFDGSTFEQNRQDETEGG
jgi:hypothetical protein